MTEFMTEEEQIQQLKTWLKQYGPTIIAGMLLALVIVSGWHYWERYQTNKLVSASMIYDEMLTLKAQNNAGGTVLQAQKLIKQYPNTPYAGLAAMALARDAIANKNLDEAVKQLNWTVNHGSNGSFREIARARIARILLAQQKPDDALKLLDKSNDENFAGMVNEIRGDAFMMKNDMAKAKEAYQLALRELPAEEGSQRPLLQMKLDNLA